MRIALFLETYTPSINGVVTHVSILKKGLEELGHKVLIVYADTETRKHYIEDGILHCPAKGIKKLYGYGLAVPFSRKRLELLREFDPDVIHVHQEFGVGLSGFFFAKILKVPLVYTLHTMYDEYVFYVAPRMLLKVTQKVLHGYERMLAKSADVLVGPSPKVAEFFRNCGITKEVELVPNTADLETFKPNVLSKEEKETLLSKLGIPSDATVGCFVGRLGKEKSVDLVIENMAEKLKDENVYLIVVGTGPEEDNLKEFAKGKGMADKIKFIGRIEHSDVAKYYDIGDFFITASITEMHSISMLEALSSGLTVIERYDELNASQIAEGVNGMIFKDAEEMKNCIMKIKNMTEEERALKKQQVRATVEKSGAKELAEYLLKFYNAKKDGKKE